MSYLAYELLRRRPGVGKGYVVDDALVREHGEIQTSVFTIHDQLAQPSCHGGSVLQAVPRKAGCDNEVLQFINPRANNGIGVHAILVVVADPAAFVFDGIELAAAVCHEWPEIIIELSVIQFPIEAGFFFQLPSCRI